MGPTIVFIKEEDVIIVAWILTMHECELSITLTNENESSILAHSNKTNTNQAWNTKECVVVLVQMQASIIKH
jgi:hypothetical protein